MEPLRVRRQLAVGAGKMTGAQRGDDGKLTG